MEQVFASDYEDVYRVKDGVMFYVKKYNRVRDKKLVDTDALSLKIEWSLKTILKIRAIKIVV